MWSELTSDSWVLNQVAGIQVEFYSGPPEQTFSPREYTFSQEDRRLLGIELARMENKRIIKRTKATSDQFLSNVMLKHKKDGSIRCILNLSKFNDYVRYDHFKMETLSHALRLMRPGCWFASIDLKDAYYAFKIHADHRKYFRFTFQGILWEFLGAPNGYSRMPFIFSKVLRVALGHLRCNGVNCVGYLDDMFFQHPHYEGMIGIIQSAAILFDKLGFTVHMKKSVLTPVQEIEFLGFRLSSVSMTVRPTTRKCEKIKGLCAMVLTKTHITVRELSQVIGHLVALSQAVEFGPVFYKRLEIIRNKTLRQYKGNWDAPTPICDVITSDLKWWIANIDIVYKNVEPRPYTRSIYTDASSKKGWGGTSEGETTSGIWTEEEMSMHINYLELLAAFLCLQSFITVRDQHIKLFSDNNTTVACINRQGSTKTDLNQLTRRLCLWCIETNNRVTAVHIPGRDNIEADCASRIDKSEIEWQLNVNVFERLNVLFGPFSVDLFASRINHQLPKYVAWKKDPGSWATNALTVDFNTLPHAYAFPPFSLIPTVLQKVDREKAEITMIVPMWKAQTWFPQLLRMLVDTPLILPSTTNLLRHPQDQKRKHPLLPKMKLLACRLSGKDWKAKEFRDAQLMSSCAPGDPVRNGTMIRTTKNGCSFAIEGKLLHCAPMETHC